ncbi:esterase E4-like [Maniola hyperantus]|uniref:esterase E4-like n=1 Tax=Aphantopus hyperantus TaxID=2795564 RepID=UPI0015680413|nr:esterase E4-like [Maniola hyperantus]
MLVEKSLVILSFLLYNVSSFNVKVKIDQGVILGTKESTVFNEKQYYAFYGVPYAQAPVGKLRFKDPKPVKKWTRPLDATTEYRGACAQAHIVHKHGQYGFENCLYLNIYTPNLPHQEKQTLKAVIVWIHGYAFTSSFSHIHGGDFLIDNDVIVISLTHRLGAFGFLKLNETDSNANMGIKDIVIGLKWIKQNVRFFSGDRKKITVMGSGSASTLLSLLLVTKYRKLFTKMILQSGSIFSPSIFQSNYEMEKQRLEKEMKTLGVKDLNSATSKEIIQASHKIYSSRDVINFQRSIVPFSPIIERKSNKSLLTMDIYDDRALKSLNFSKIPILIGFTSQESISEVIPFIHNTNYLKLFHSFFKFMVPFGDGYKYEYSSQIYRHISKEIKSWYFQRSATENSIDEFLEYVSDLHKYPTYKFIQFVLSLRSEIYVYKFNYLGKFNAVKSTSLAGSYIKVKGAAQGDEICYILKCDPLWESYVKLRKNKHNKDRIFIENISQMWANFAKTGKPTSIKHYGNVTWRPMTLKEDNVFLFDKHNKLINSEPERKMFLFWKKIYEKYYDPKKSKRQSKDEL